MQGTITPDGYFTIGLSSPRKIRQEDKEYERDLQRYIDSYYLPGDWRSPGEEIFFKEYSTDVLPQAVQARIGSSIPRNFNNPARYGLKGITANGKRIVRSACSVLEAMYDKTQLAFLTLTVPSLPAFERDRVNRHWSKITNHLLTVLRRELKAAGGVDYVVGVTEVQEKRWIASRTLYYHFHICFVAHFGDFSYFISPTKIRLIWMRCLNAQLSEGHKLTPKMVAATEQLKTIKKSCGRYMAKYMSKGAKGVQMIIDGGMSPDQIPGQWWLCSRSLRDIVRRCVRSLPPEFISLARSCVDSFRDSTVFAWMQRVEVCVNGVTSVLGIVGYVSPRVHQEFLRTFDIGKAISFALQYKCTRE